jgi:hypothetical protein
MDNLDAKFRWLLNVIFNNNRCGKIYRNKIDYYQS